MKIPYATKTSSLLSGMTLALMLSTGEHLTGPVSALCTITGAIWFPVSIAVFVHGKQSIEYKIQSLRGERPYIDIPKDITPRALVWFCSTLATAWLLSLFYQHP
ncbi:hypothetical protein M1B72_13410 [Geomonas paludis]|uniref:Uncharacterized protein n=1 Tax=Geomonas paludis TaxID=2740185 RepID=A0A6V8MW62_9BACT|nr:hypothetical protein [Geomonas paludis]UPU34447.1 hypothetical protein M1B72_13410 [Geomonas paludis]GFO64435.1 hypothetical protein GMPD_23540 [Geomonas paludis]